jgi:hypothetical protein
MRAVLRRIAPSVAAAALILIVADAGLLLLGHRWFAKLIGKTMAQGVNQNAFGQVVSGIKTITSDLQGFAIGATPLAVAAGGLSWSFGHRRGVGISIAALAGLALTLAAPTIAD